MNEVFRGLEQTSILNVYNLHGKISIFSLILIFKFENLVIFLYIFCHILGLGFA